jgi:VanZ family protein
MPISHDLRVGRQDLAVRRLSLWLLGAWALLIASASLYPFDAQWRPLLESLLDGLPRLREWREPSQRDAIVNLLLYLPFGLLGSMALENSRSAALRIIVPVVGAAVLSLGVEIAQHALPPRDPSLADWILNVASAGVGTLLAAVYSALPVRPLSRRLQRIALGPAPALLVALWLIAHLAPFVPRLRPGRIESAIETSISLNLVWPTAFYYLACYLVLAALLHALLRRPFFWSAVLALFVASLVSRLLFVGQHLSPSEVIGAIGALLSVLLLRRLDLQLWPSRAFAMAALAVFVAGIWPVTPVAAVTLAAPEPIWLPFAELAGLPADPGALPLLERLFLGIGLAWLAVHGGTRLLPPLPLVILIALTVEFLQQWIPGRVPDTTDVAALLIGAALASVAPRIDPRT